jgi:hypothetical protein
METMHVINLKRSKERWEHMTKEWQNDFQLEKYEAVDAKIKKIKGNQACKESHLGLLKSLKSVVGKKYHIVCEDDIYKTKNFYEMWPGILEYIQTNNDWDIISLDPFLNVDFCNIRSYNKTFNKIDIFRNLGFAIYSHDFIIKLDIDKYLKTWGIPDMTIARNINFRKLTPKKLCVRQIEGVSERLGKNTNYRSSHNWDETEKELLEPTKNYLKYLNNFLGIFNNMDDSIFYCILILIMVMIVSLYFFHKEDISPYHIVENIANISPS